LIAGFLTGLNLALNKGIDITPGLALDPSQEGLAFSPGWLIVAIVCLIAFIYVERRSASPLLDLNAYRKRNFSAASFVNLLMGFCVMAGLVSVPLYINTVPTVLYGLELNQAALLAGYLLSAFTIPMAFASLLGGWLAGRVGYRWPTVFGAGLACFGFWRVSRWSEHVSEGEVALMNAGLPNLLNNWDLYLGAGRMLVGLLLAGIGVGVTISPIATAVVNAVGTAERGVASSLVIIMRLIGMTLSISALTSYGVRRVQTLLTLGLEGVDLTDFATQSQVLVQSTTQVINEMALITGLVCFGALLMAFFMRDGDEDSPSH
jgi:MFS family permease